MPMLCAVSLKIKSAFLCVLNQAKHSLVYTATVTESTVMIIYINLEFLASVLRLLLVQNNAQSWQ